ncbi:MAG: DUF1971 domain-containing protein [Gammaproteobacteria bacterium]|nr:DUF1971 domain-containing protein [Gammaproteobacteria bacterium]
MTNQLPNDLIPSGASPVFTQDTLPDALQAEHTLAPGHWGVLNVLEGSLRFVNLETGDERLISAPDRVTIHPGLPHRVALEGRLRCRIDFYREPPAESDDNQGSTIGESVDSAAEMGKRGVRSVQAGAGAVKKAVASIPRVVRRIAGKEKAGSEALPEEAIKVSAERLPDEALKCYLAVLVWLVHTDDDLIDEREMCEIQLLATQRRCNREVRKAVREHLENPHGLDARTLIDDLLEYGPEAGTAKRLGLKCALMKDAIRVRRSTTDGPVLGQPGIRHLAETLELNDKQVEFIEDACEQDEKILSGELSDTTIMNAAKDLTAKAGAAGVPLGVIYVGGSVTGLSAAGITSGLATLGMGGVLGLSAMVTGIGVAIIMGGAVYQGVRWVLGRSERDKVTLRELMLQEVLRTHQQAIINLGEDMSHFGDRIAELAGQTERHRAAIDMLSREVTLLSRSARALTRLGKRASGIEGELQKAAGHAAQ